ncbi:MAG TPA: DNA-3-methyladenine glycosylase [Acidimicrobiales bacterium]|nr:DNA-3-methyladenine glycosylase [Acidimicrobiales bacterium]
MSGFADVRRGDAAVRRLGRDDYRRDPRALAPDLLGKLLVHDDAAVGPRIGRIVEVEAYCGEADPGSHAFRGPTPRNRTMFGPPGGLYVYFTYGMHWCANVVCGDEGEGVAVLLRALSPLEGIDAMRAARPAARRDRDLCNGPAKLCQAFALDGTFDGSDLVTADRGVWVGDDGTAPPVHPFRTTRIGLSAGAEHPWRWCVPGDPHVSGPVALRGVP